MWFMSNFYIKVKHTQFKKCKCIRVDVVNQVLRYVSVEVKKYAI
jgi:hypothetical protein